MPDSACHEDAGGGPPSLLGSGLTGESGREDAGAAKPRFPVCSLAPGGRKGSPSPATYMMLVGRAREAFFTFGARRPDAAECPASHRAPGSCFPPHPPQASGNLKRVGPWRALGRSKSKRKLWWESSVVAAAHTWTSRNASRVKGVAPGRPPLCSESLSGIPCKRGVLTLTPQGRGKSLHDFLSHRVGTRPTPSIYEASLKSQSMARAGRKPTRLRNLNMKATYRGC